MRLSQLKTGQRSNLQYFVSVFHRLTSGETQAISPETVATGVYLPTSETETQDSVLHLSQWTGRVPKEEVHKLLLATPLFHIT